MAPDESAKICTECGKRAGRLRKERCDACYMRLYRGGEVPSGASCAGCEERRHDVLTLAELAGGEVVVCGNCALVLRRARPRIDDVAELRRRVERDRRRLADRRRGAAFRPVGMPERRSEPRRASDRVIVPVVPVLDPSID